MSVQRAQLEELLVQRGKKDEQFKEHKWKSAVRDSRLQHVQHGWRSAAQLEVPGTAVPLQDCVRAARLPYRATGARRGPHTPLSHLCMHATVCRVRSPPQAARDKLAGRCGPRAGVAGPPAVRSSVTTVDMDGMRSLWRRRLGRGRRARRQREESAPREKRGRRESALGDLDAMSDENQHSMGTGHVRF